ncbi:MAG: AAA family ATPase [Burkholderiales bacterium]|jgi:ATP-dependent Lon protease|nr:AAA family ATPase [Rhodocyclaceae bacterium]MCA3021300.1 AAA family ATPase [Rhodocyclaceae bacterium]MCA3054377.1 AAA family ATPase [Rhodocyclaceae bacterium]
MNTKKIYVSGLNISFYPDESVIFRPSAVARLFEQYRDFFLDDFFIDGPVTTLTFDFLSMVLKALNKDGYNGVVYLTRVNKVDPKNLIPRVGFVLPEKTGRYSRGKLACEVDELLTKIAMDMVMEHTDVAMDENVKVPSGEMSQLKKSPLPLGMDAPSDDEAVARGHDLDKQLQPGTLWEYDVDPESQMHKIFDSKKLSERVKQLSTMTSSHEKYYAKQLEELLKSGNLRPVGLAPPVEKIEQLALKFPNMTEVVERVADSVRLAHRGDGTFRFESLLLLGPPGVGKTHFAKALAAVAGVNFTTVHMETASTGWLLAGLDRGWSNGRMGRVAKMLTMLDSANPIFLVDEVDKATGGRYDPISALYSLLERHTARTFQDEFLEVEMDASRINWILTANDVKRMQKPLLSRMVVIEVPAPTREQCLSIAAGIYAELREFYDWGEYFDPTPPADVMEQISVCSPRIMKQLLLEAFGRASRNDRTTLLADDINKNLLPKRETVLGFT